MADHPAKNLAEKYLKGMEKRGELLPGSTERILAMISPAGGASSVLRATIASLEEPPKASDRLPFANAPRAEPPAAKFLNPEYQGGPELPLRAVLARLEAGDHLRPGSAEKLVQHWAADFAGKGTGSLVDGLARKLSERENWSHLVDPPAPSPREGVIDEVLSMLGPQLPAGPFLGHLRDALIKSSGGHGTGATLARHVAKQIQTSTTINGGRKIAIDWLDPLFQDSPAPDGRRAESNAMGRIV